MSDTPKPERNTLWLCLRFLVFAPICLVLWLMMLPAYTWLVCYATFPILKYVFQFPIEGVAVTKAGFLNMETSLTYPMGQYMRVMTDMGHLLTNIAPYVALILATPKLNWLRRFRILGAGVGVIFVFHVVTILLRFMAGKTSLPTAFGFIAITLPFLLWIVLAYWDKLIAYLGSDDSTAA
jgi:hypothetical protein